MSRALKRKIDRLKADAAPVFAARMANYRRWKEEQASDARRHLLRVVAVFRFGEPKPNEPLRLAYERAIALIGSDDEGNDAAPIEKEAAFFAVRWAFPRDDDDVALEKFENMLKEEHPAGDITLLCEQLIREIPAWLLLFCRVRRSAEILGIQCPPPPVDLFVAAPENPKDASAWPRLPTGVLKFEARTGLIAFLSALSEAELEAFAVLVSKSKSDCTRRESKFMWDLVDCFLLSKENAESDTPITKAVWSSKGVSFLSDEGRGS